MVYYETNYLAHHGVKGMKWGHRKQVEKKGRQKTSEKKKWSTKKKVAVGAAIVGGTALAAIGGYSLYKLAKKKKKSYALSPEQLKAMGIKVFEPDRIKIDTVKVNRVKPDFVALNEKAKFAYAPHNTYRSTWTSEYTDGTRKIRFSSNNHGLSKAYTQRKLSSGSNIHKGKITKRITSKHG